MLLRVCGLLVIALVPVVVFFSPNPIPRHSLDWWLVSTPKCLGPVCINVLAPGQTLISIEVPWSP